ncbi:sigma-54-dependent transcriptional regulator [Paraliomyxa miuraensis]|uniref:sigma-54-dependent transcriptional regulator n=1 Tax=Paraliomyxa miuraensis TaxID=376150 RepID=UPI0022540D74|nr:sigma-54 dependent transcriptional regulator [Paraliomyxa miuraensis]MCX4243499.1 sigma-54 dependent transcriptional regulator [Paraliomyxa miuraensis]
MVEDDDEARAALRIWLEREGFAVCTSPCGRQALAVPASGLDAVVLDFGLPDVDGFDVLRRLRATAPRLPVIMLTGQGSVEHAVEAMKRGAFHYVTKPVALDELARVLREAVAIRRRPQQVRRAGPSPSAALEADPTTALVGPSEAMARVRGLIHKLGRASEATVLVTGESGTGKDLAARALHAVSARAGRRLTNVTCTALPTTLLESELFGHERGAFTDAKARHRGLLEQAAGGTIFLDEIGDMDPSLQAKLLRVLEDKRYRRVGGTEDLWADVRVVAATHVDLPAAVREGRFREDLYYRLAVLVLPMPALRERPQDVPALVRSFLERHAADGDEIPRVTDDALRTMMAHDWPGNVRELRNVIERAVVLCEDGIIDVDDLELLRPPTSHGVAELSLPTGGIDIRRLERELLLQALERTRGNVTRAARLLGMSRDQVRYRIQKLSQPDVAVGSSS